MTTKKCFYEVNLGKIFNVDFVSSQAVLCGYFFERVLLHPATHIKIN